jgi:hypothetical protein
VGERGFRPIGGFRGQIRRFPGRLNLAVLAKPGAARYQVRERFRLWPDAPHGPPQ